MSASLLEQPDVPTDAEEICAIEDLPPDQDAKLAELEAIIASGLQTCFDVGAAMKEIRVSKLYRKTHSTFEQYVRERWDITGRRARQLMSASQTLDDLTGAGTEPDTTGTNVPPLQSGETKPADAGETKTTGETERAYPTKEEVLKLLNEAGARELGALTPEMKRLVWAEVVKTPTKGNKKVTAKFIKETVERIEDEQSRSRKLETIRQPSIFPVDAERPVCPSDEFVQTAIQDAINFLREGEPNIEKLTHTESEKLWAYIETIYDYAKPIDERFVDWAREVERKLIAWQGWWEPKSQLEQPEPTQTPEPQSDHSAITEINRLESEIQSDVQTLNERIALIKILEDRKAGLLRSAESDTGSFEEAEEPKRKRLSRPKRWAAACAAAEAALSELIDLQLEYQEWLDSLPENLQGGALAEKLGAITEIGIQDAMDLVNEAGEADLPLGFGRD